MAGSIVKRGERTWLVRISSSTDGKRSFHNHTVHGTKRDAERYLNAALRSRDLGTFVEPARMTVDAYLDKWLETAARPRVRPRTFQDYAWLLRQYVRPALGARRLDQVTPLDIQALYTAMGERVTARTVRSTHNVVRNAFKQAVLWRMLPQNPAANVTLPKGERKEMRALTAEEAERFRRAADELEREDRVPAGKKRPAGRSVHGFVFTFTLATGMRPGEVLALRWQDCDLEAGRVTVRRNLVRLKGGVVRFDEPKTPKSRRVLPLPSSVAERLRAHRREQAELRLLLGPEYADQGLVFANLTGGPLDSHNLTGRDLKAILRRAGLPQGLRWYDLRHTCATLLLAAGENAKVVSERLGHAAVTLTLDLYAHVLPGMQERAAERLEEMLFGRG
ncbi:MAG TPA: site-specific integrase [Myxococcota bacterium]|nr:site-specific integrase [Myxococcota bacterium]